MQIEQLITTLEQNYKDYPILLQGDFNSNPQFQTYPRVLSSPLQFSSAYFNKLKADSEPEFTTRKIRTTLQSHTIDYIFVKDFSVTAVLSIPSAETIGETALPSERYPSDHLALAAKLTLNLPRI